MTVGNQVVRPGKKEIKARNKAMMIRKGMTPRETSAALDLARSCKMKRFMPSAPGPGLISCRNRNRRK